MGFSRTSYLEKNPARRTYDVGGITWTVPHDAAFDMLTIFKKHGLKRLTEEAVNDVVLNKGKAVFRELAKAIILDPPICDTKTEAIEKNGLTLKEINPQHINQLVGKLMAAWEVDGQAEAATFQDPGPGHGAGPSRPGVEHAAPPLAD